MKTKSMRKRMIAFTLAAVTVFGTVAPVLGNTAKAVSHEKTTPVIDQNGDLEKARDLGIDMLIRGLETYVPGGRVLAPAVKLIIDSMIGKGKGLSLEDINKKIDNMFSNLDNLNNDLRDSIENITAIQSFDSFQFKTFNSQIHEIISQIEVIRTDDIPENEKIAEIAALINDSRCWPDSNSVFVTFSNLTQALNRPSLTKRGDIFTLLYKHYSKSCMFSGEALDKASDAVDLIMTDYVAGYYVLLQCLGAQVTVCNMTPEEKSQLNPKAIERISGSQSLINKKVAELHTALMGDDGSSGIKGLYDTFTNTNRMLFIDKDTCEIDMSPNLTVTDHHSVPVYKSCVDGSGRRGPIFKSTTYFNENIATKMGLDGDKIKDIATYINGGTSLTSFLFGKNISMRQYLKKNGFNVDCIPQNAYILTSKAYNDAQDASNIGTALGGTLMLHTFYKGINIDEVNPNEKEVRLYHTGTHGYGIEEWNFVEDGNIVTFNQIRAEAYGSYWDRDGH